MIIKIKTEPKAKWQDFEIEPLLTIEEIISEYCKQNDFVPEHMYYAASVNNTLKELTYVITGSCNIEFLDLQNQSVQLLYQQSLSLLFLKAADDILGKVDIQIPNALNKGLFIERADGKAFTKDDVLAIRNRMRELVSMDIPIETFIVPRNAVWDWLFEEGLKQKLRILKKRSELEYVKFCAILDYKNFFYGLMVPSTRYLTLFDLELFKKGILLRYPKTSNPDRIQVTNNQKMLYTAYKESLDWHRLMGITYVQDLNEAIERHEEKELILLSEALQEKKIVEIANEIVDQGKRIVLIAGPSSSGKTTFSMRLCVQLRICGVKPVYLGTDDYFLDREFTPKDKYGEPDYENLSALDLELFNSNLNDLLDGKEVDVPSFNFITGKKEFGKRKIKMTEDQPIVIEGIHGLNEKLTERIPRSKKYKIYISPFTQLNIDNHNRIPAADARMLRRMTRDYAKRAHSATDTLREWPKVRAGEEKNIFPYIDESDVVFNSVHMYEISVLKKYAKPLLESVPESEPEHLEAIRMLKFLEFFDVIEDDSPIANNSILREFIGGSIFVKD